MAKSLLVAAGVLLAVGLLMLGSREEAPHRSRSRPAAAPALALSTLEETPAPPAPPAPGAAPAEDSAPVPLREVKTDEEQVVINEIHYHPPSGDRRDEWIELFNRSSSPADIGGFRLGDGVTFKFPAGTVLPPGGYLVVAAEAARVRAAYGIDNVIGDFTGSLHDRKGTIRLFDRGDKEVETVTYKDKPPFPVLPDGMGRSLERRDPSGPSSFAGNWGASATEGWVRVRATGAATSNRLYIYLLGSG